MADKYLGREGLQTLINRVKGSLDEKQDKLSGSSSQIVGFDENGNAVATDIPVSENSVELAEKYVVLPIGIYWRDITYGDGKFVAVASSSDKVAYSTDGINWSLANLPVSADFYRIAYGDGKFVAVGYNNPTVAYSTDGINWSLANLPVNASWKCIAYGDGKFVAIGGTTVAYSTDGINWNTTKLSSATWMDIAYGDGKFVAVAQNSTTVAYSTDGISWKYSTLPISTYWEDVTYGDGKFVAVAQNGSNVAYSTDGINWNTANLPVSASWVHIAYGDGKFVAIGGTTVAYSTDGINWNLANLPVIASWKGIAYGDGKFVTAAYNTTTSIYSTDGINWKQTVDTLQLPDGTDVTDRVRTALNVPEPSSGMTQEEADERYLQLTGGTVTGDFRIDGPLSFGSKDSSYPYITPSSDGNNPILEILGQFGDEETRISGIADPQNENDAANKRYVDNAVSEAADSRLIITNEEPQALFPGAIVFVYEG